MCPLNFLFIFLHVFDTSPKLRVLKLIVHRGLECVIKVPVQYRFQWRKQLLVACRGQLGKKDTEFIYSIVLLQNRKTKLKRIIVVLKCIFFFFFLRKLTKMSSLILCFSEFLKLFFVSAWGRSLFYLRTEKCCLP